MKSKRGQLKRLDRVQKLGGALEAIKSGYIQKEIQRSAYKFQRAVDEGEKVIVGVNRFESSEREPIKVLQVSKKSVKRQLKQIKKYRMSRNKSRFEKAISALEKEASKDQRK